jgi:RND family efflux transporter MFP subunit
VLVLLSVCSRMARADTPVAATVARSSPSYEVARTYAGTLVPRRSSELGFKGAGEIAAVAVDIGDSVEAGELLASLDTESLEAEVAEANAGVTYARASLSAAAAELDLARQTESRSRRLRDKGHTSVQTHDELELDVHVKQARLALADAALDQAEAQRRRAEVALTDAHIKAPYAGVVQSRYADEGHQATPGQPLLRLLELTNPEAHVGVPAIRREALTTGDAYHIRWHGREIEARLKAVLPEIDARSRTLTAVFVLEETSVPAGDLVELVMQQPVQVRGFWIPTTALAERARGLWSLYVLGDEAMIKERLVEILHTEGNRAYVRGALEDGETIIETGMERVVPGQAVTVASLRSDP